TRRLTGLYRFRQTPVNAVFTGHIAFLNHRPPPGGRIGMVAFDDLVDFHFWVAPAVLEPFHQPAQDDQLLFVLGGDSLDTFTVHEILQHAAVPILAAV